MRSNFSCRIWHRRSQRFRDSCGVAVEAARREAARTSFSRHTPVRFPGTRHATAARSCLESRPLRQSAVMSKPDAEETKGGRPPLNQRRGQILEKAAQLFRVKGYEATSMSDIADEVGITKAGLYYFVESKEHLLYLITDYGLDLLEETVVRPLEGVQDPRELLEKLIERHVHMLLTRPREVTIILHERTALTGVYREKVQQRKEAVHRLRPQGAHPAPEEGRGEKRNRRHRGDVLPVGCLELGLSVVQSGRTAFRGTARPRADRSLLPGIPDRRLNRFRLGFAARRWPKARSLPGADPEGRGFRSGASGRGASPLPCSRRAAFASGFPESDRRR